jgi:alanyl-tRNA synthetase
MALRKALDKETKEKEAVANKAAIEIVGAFFHKNPQAEAYFAIVDVEGNAKILQAVVLQAKKLGKAVYVFSVDSEGGRVIHVNHVPESLRLKGFDARTWAARVTETLGGKAGGKEDGAQGVGLNTDKVREALEVAENYLLDGKA